MAANVLLSLIILGSHFHPWGIYFDREQKYYQSS